MTLKGKVALVTGGSRGAGRGIALELARKGAFVYITGRTTEASGIEHSKRSIDNVLREIKAEGGSGSAIRCDHTKDQETEAVIRQIASEQGKLDILVNNVWGGNDLPIEQKSFWELPTAHWDNMFNAGVRAQLITNYYAIPLMREAKAGGLIIHTTFWDHYKYLGNFYYDLSKTHLSAWYTGYRMSLKRTTLQLFRLLRAG